jgi:hypothetical protein
MEQVKYKYMISVQSSGRPRVNKEAVWQVAATYNQGPRKCMRKESCVTDAEHDHVASSVHTDTHENL